jgi:SAM-dependent methyltransferase
VRVTGERASTPAAGFRPQWERHVFAYAAAGDLLPEGRVLDLGCGVGHSYHLLSPRETVGVDVSSEALDGQDRETVVADMRELPFADRSFASVLSVHSIEHVPDPERVLREVVRVLVPGGKAIFVTPNRLTFGRPDEIIDPYHCVEFDAAQLRELCAPFFAKTRILGIMGSRRYATVVEQDHRKLNAILRLDPFRLRRLIPRRTRQHLYDLTLTRARARASPLQAEIGPEDFQLAEGPLDEAYDLLAECSLV